MIEVRTKRFGELDLLKGFGILLMIMGHIPVNQHLVHFIYIFHMPLFFLVSGFLYRDKPESVKNIAFACSRKLLHPYAFFSIMGMGLLLLETKNSVYECAQRSLIAICFFNTENMPIVGALWYLTAALFVYVAFVFFKRKITNERVFGSIVCLLSFIGLLWPKITDCRLPWAIDVAFVGLGFYYTGFLYAKHKQKIDLLLDRNRILCFSSFFLCFLCGMLNDKISMRTCTYGDEFCFVVCAVSLTLFFYKIACRLAPQKNFLVDIVKEIGRKSIFFLCMNEIVINVTYSVLSKMSLSGSILTCSELLMSLFILIFMEKVVCKYTKIQKMIGIRNL